MLKYALLITTALVLGGCSQTFTPKEIAEQSMSGVVLIENIISDTEGGIGTGFFIADNMIITNAHVVEGDGTIKVRAKNSGIVYDSRVVFRDKVSDLAIVELKDWELFQSKESPVILEFNNSEVQQGESIVAIGHPWGLGWSISTGIVSSTKNRPRPNIPTFLYQVDSHLYEGNSGGPVVDSNGEVRCISSLMLAGNGGSYGFCIPTPIVQKVLYDFKKFGEVKWNALNVEVGLTGDGYSVKIVNVIKDGAADKAGLKAGDIINKIYTSKNHPSGLVPRVADDIICSLAILPGDEEKIKLEITRGEEVMLIDVIMNKRLSSEYNVDAK